MEALKVNLMPELETVPWTPNVKLGNSPFKTMLVSLFE